MNVAVTLVYNWFEQESVSMFFSFVKVCWKSCAKNWAKIRTKLFFELFSEDKFREEEEQCFFLQRMEFHLYEGLRGCIIMANSIKKVLILNRMTKMHHWSMMTGPRIWMQDCTKNWRAVDPWQSLATVIETELQPTSRSDLKFVKKLTRPIFRRKNFTHWKRVNQYYFCQQ